jgi:hypothetical protein
MKLTILAMAAIVVWSSSGIVDHQQAFAIEQGGNSPGFVGIPTPAQFPVHGFVKGPPVNAVCLAPMGNIDALGMHAVQGLGTINFTTYFSRVNFHLTLPYICITVHYCELSW